jgi:DNA-binding CsgD family transcriptional regulator
VVTLGGAARLVVSQVEFDLETKIQIGPIPRRGLKTVRSTLIRRRKQSEEAQDEHSPFTMQAFVLCERSSGAVRFRVDAEPDGSMPVEKVAGLLAVHCLVRGQAPEDYELLVVPRESLLEAAAERAQELLAAGRALGAGVKVSRREQEVLDCILQGMSNKEIASRLNVAERTVKFHVSSLLAKFGVTDRVALSREASLGRLPQFSALGQVAPETLFGFPLRIPQAIPDTASTPTIERTPAPPREAASARNRLVPMFARERYAT